MKLTNLLEAEAKSTAKSFHSIMNQALKDSLEKIEGFKEITFTYGKPGSFKFEFHGIEGTMEIDADFNVHATLIDGKHSEKVQVSKTIEQFEANLKSTLSEMTDASGGDRELIDRINDLANNTLGGYDFNQEADAEYNDSAYSVSDIHAALKKELILQVGHSEGSGYRIPAAKITVEDNIVSVIELDGEGDEKGEKETFKVTDPAKILAKALKTDLHIDGLNLRVPTGGFGGGDDDSDDGYGSGRRATDRDFHMFYTFD